LAPLRQSECEGDAQACAATAKGLLICARGSAPRLYLGIKVLRRLIEISKQGRAEPALHIQVYGAIPVTAVLISTYPVEPVLVTEKGGGGEYQREGTLGVRNICDHSIRSLHQRPPRTALWLKPTRGSLKTHMPRCLYGAMTLMVFMVILQPL
jgi:hypothetical protein